MLNAVLIGVGIGSFLLDKAYHRWFEDKPLRKKQMSELSLPRVDDGTAVPLIYGRVRVRGPILAWHGTPSSDEGDPDTNTYPTGSRVYSMNMFFVLGVGMADGTGTNRVHAMWMGETKFVMPANGAPDTEMLAQIDASRGVDLGLIGGLLYFYEGDYAQDVGATIAGAKMIDDGIDVFQIPSYFGYISVLLYDEVVKWLIGSRPSIAQYSFEASSYKSTSGWPAVGIYAQCGQDSNPINVLYDLIISKFGKLGLSSSYIDIASWQAAATTLYNEGHGYSRVIDSRAELDKHIQEILRQIDGVMDIDPITGRLIIKLIRNDYDPSTVPHITRASGAKLSNFVAAGWPGQITSVRVVYPNRAKDYQDDSELSPNQAVSIDQGMEEHVIEFPGCCTQQTAQQIVGRELAALSRPWMKFRLHLDRRYQTLMRGDAIKVTWSKPDISGLIFRVADVSRGTLEDGRVIVDVIQDYYYVYRGQAPRESNIGGIGLDDIVIGG